MRGILSLLFGSVAGLADWMGEKFSSFMLTGSSDDWTPEKSFWHELIGGCLMFLLIVAVIYLRFVR